MEALQVIVGLFLIMAQGCIHELPDQITRHDNNKILISMFDCQNRRFKALSMFCEQGKGFWSRPFYLEELNSGIGFYMNQFGEIQVSQQVSMNQVHMPECGRQS